MEKIKFRAYLGGVMHPIWTRIDEDVYKTHPDIKIMQFTGLLDKNGKEIYFDDIVKTKLGERELIGKVCWIKFAIFIDYGQSQEFIDATGQAHKVIGDIWETPELLK